MPLERRGVSRRAGTLATAATLALAATILLATTCGSDDDGADDNTSTTSPETSSSTTLSVEEEVEAAYLAFWEMFVRLAQAPNPEDPEIEQRTSGEAQDNIIDGLAALRTRGERSVFGPDYSHDVLRVEIAGEGRVVLEDCAVDDSRLVNAQTGETIRQATVTEHLRATLHLEGGRWLVDQTSRLNSWDGKVACQSADHQ